MKSFFIFSAIILAGLTALLVATMPEHRSVGTEMYWTSDANPVRGPQMAAFENWMTENGYPAVDMKLDVNYTAEKVIIQSVSGVASDVINMGGRQMRQYVAAGVLMDVTSLAQQYGFGPDETYDGVKAQFMIGDRQYAFPNNVTALPLTINRALLERENLPLPPFTWTWDEFLQWCLAVRKVDANGEVTRYACWPFGAAGIWPGNGGSYFNETMTRCACDSPQVLEATNFYYDLMFRHRVLPTPVARASLAGKSSVVSADDAIQWLGKGLVAGVRIGRYSLIWLREFPEFAPDVALLPHRIVPMQTVAGGQSGISAGTRHPELAARFLQFLASDTYGKLFITYPDALPPNPDSVKDPEFFAPPDHPAEHYAHRKYLRATKEFGVGEEYSPFVLAVTVEKLYLKYVSGIESKAITVEQALEDLTKEVNRAIDSRVARDPELKLVFDKAMHIQQQIDQLKASNSPVPLHLIANPVLRRLQGVQK
jgi:ABC-type glycerol-3-phosphate transport system substrate-binding protein